METIQALEAIAASKMADIGKRAAAMFPGGTPPNDRFTRPEVLLKIFPERKLLKPWMMRVIYTRTILLVSSRTISPAWPGGDPLMRASQPQASTSRISCNFPSARWF